MESPSLPFSLDVVGLFQGVHQDQQQPAIPS